jgi:DNA-binding NtrC family response regulator
MPGRGGIDLIRRIREFSQVPIIVVTSYPSVPTCETAMREGAQRFLRWREDLDRLGEIAVELVRAAHPCPHPSASTELSAIRARRQDDLRHQLAALLRCNNIGRRSLLARIAIAPP